MQLFLIKDSINRYLVLSPVTEDLCYTSGRWCSTIEDAIKYFPQKDTSWQSTSEEYIRSYYEIILNPSDFHEQYPELLI